MPHYKTSIYSGDVLEIEEYFAPRPAGKYISRRNNENLTTAQQQEINRVQAQKKLSRLINCNFTKGDAFITLTYAKIEDEENSRKEMGKFLRRLRGYCRKNNLPELKYIAVTESEDARLHHHMVLTALPLDAIIDCWICGRVIASRLSPEGDYAGLARYITKDSKKEGKRWSQSRNLKKPRVVRKEIKRASGILKPPKGYRVIQQHFYVSDATGKSQYLKAIKINGYDYAGETPDAGRGGVKNE